MELDIHTIKQKSLKSLVSLFIRTFFMQFLSIVSYFFITLFLTQKELGVYFIVSALAGFFSFFADIGLSAALIQKHTTPTNQEIKATFTIQQILVLTISLIVFLLSGKIAAFYGLSQTGLYLLYALIISFILSSFKTIPSVLAERHLDFDKLVIVHIAESIIFNLTVVILAWQGQGLYSYIYAILAQAIFGVIALNLMIKWPFGYSLSLTSLKGLLHFGIPYQFNSLLAQFKDRLMIMVLGKIIGSQGVGILGWAEKWANLPLRYIMDNTMKVAFPAWSRLQHQQEILKKAIEITLFVLSFLIFPIAFGLLISAKPFVLLVPKYQKWLPAIIPLYFYIFNAIIASISTPLTNALSATGKIKLVSLFMIYWTIITWLFTPYLAYRLGFIGVAYSVGIIAILTLPVIYISARQLNIQIIPSILPNLINSAFIAFVGFLLFTNLPLSWPNFIITITLCAFLYIFLSIKFLKHKLIKSYQLLFNK